MNRKVIITAVTVLVLTAGLSWKVFARGFYNLEAFAGLPKEKQTLLIETMKSNREKNSALRDEMRSTKKAMIEALTAPEFDESAFEKNAEKLRELQNRRFETMTESVKSLAPGFTQQEREALASMFQHRRHWQNAKQDD